MSTGAELDEVFDAFIEGRADFAQFRNVVEEQLALAPELAGAALLRLDSLRRDGRLSPALHALMTREVERGSGGDLTPPFDEEDAADHPPSPSAPKTVAAEAPVVSALHVASHPAQTPAREPEIGTVLGGRYRLEELLGRGGMHLVYRAEDLRLGGGGTAAAQVAVKVLLPKYSGQLGSRGLEWEASILAGLSHPGILQAHDFDRDGETVFLVTELLRGQRLRNLLMRTHPAPPPKDEAMGIIRELAEALSYLHASGVVHRDVQPANVFVTDAGEVRLIDFGIAAPIGGGSHHGSPAHRPGTPAYASPEVLAGRLPDPRDDVYSLGCIAYELLTGRHPWDKAPGDEAADRRLKAARPPGLREPQWGVLRRALSFKAANRPADAGVFLSGWYPAAQPRRAAPWIAAAVLALIGIGIGVVIFAPGTPTVRPAATPTPAATAPAPTLPAVPEREVAEVPPSDAPPEAIAPTDPGRETEDATPLSPAARERLVEAPPLIATREVQEPPPAERPVAVAPEPEVPAAETPTPEAPAPETPAQVAERPADDPAPVPEQPAPSPSPRPAPESRPPEAAPAALVLPAPQIRIVEGESAVRLELRRPAGYPGSLRLRWRTVDRTAVEGEDYMGSPDWRWAEAPAGAESLVIFVPIINHSLPRPPRTFIVELEQVPGGPRVGSPSRTEVTIVSDN